MSMQINETLKIDIVEDGIWLSENIVYTQVPPDLKSKKGGGVFTRNAYQYHLSIVRPYTEEARQPCVVFLCGGGWRHEEYNAYIPQSSWLAHKGFTLAFVEYPCHAPSIYPEPLIHIKSAIRFLRANAEDYQIDKSRIGIWGEGAGAHLAAMAALTNGQSEYDKGFYLEESSTVQAVCTWYLPSDFLTDRNSDALFTQHYLFGYTIENRPEDIKKASPLYCVNEICPPFLLFHGTEDHTVDSEQSERMYDELVKKGVPADLYLLKGAGLERSRKTGHKVKLLRILRFKLNRAKPAQSGVNSLCVVVSFNILEYIPTSLFRIVIIGILNKLSF